MVKREIRIGSSWGLAAIATAVAVTGSPIAYATPFAYVTNQGDHSLSVIDLATESSTATIRIGEGPAGVAVSKDGQRIYISDPNTRLVYRLDGETHEVRAQAIAGKGPLGIALSPDSGYVYVADWFDVTTNPPHHRQINV